MKGDFILLCATAAAVLLVPLAVAVGSGLPVEAVPDLPAASAAETQSASASTATSAAGTDDWVATPIPGGQAVMAPAESKPSNSKSASSKSASDPPQSKPTATSSSTLPQVKSFLVLDRSTGKVNELSVRDYLRGAIAAEMPASFHLEALKAQGVAALSYALYHHNRQQQNPDPLLLGADFSADPQKREGYMTERDVKKFYGDSWEYNWAKVCQAADEAMNWVLVKDGTPIAAAYHAISSGQTEAAENIWQQPLPCLLSVDSSWDVLARDYKSTVQLTQKEIKEKLADSGVTLLPNADTWFAVEQSSPAGYVTQVRVGNQTMTGNQLRNLLGLRSSAFRIERQGKDFIFYVVGYGHGAGLSQNGADYMARQGNGFREILLHYYRGAELAAWRAG